MEGGVGGGANEVDGADVLGTEDVDAAWGREREEARTERGGQRRSGGGLRGNIKSI